MARSALRQRARADDVAHPIRRSQLRDRPGLRRPPARPADDDGSTGLDDPGAAQRRRFLRSARRDARATVDDRAHPHDAERAPRRHSVRAGRDPSALRRGRGDPVLARAGADRSGVQGVPEPLHREVQPRPLLLGGVRSGGHPVLRVARLRRTPAGLPHFPDWVAREAYSHEVCSAGFWPGGGGRGPGVLLLICVSRPGGLRPDLGTTGGGILLRRSWASSCYAYDDVRSAASPDDVLLEFLQSTYEAAARTGDWDRAALERALGPGQ